MRSTFLFVRFFLATSLVIFVGYSPLMYSQEKNISLRQPRITVGQQVTIVGQSSEPYGIVITPKEGVDFKNIFIRGYHTNVTTNIPEARGVSALKQLYDVQEGTIKVPRLDFKTYNKYVLKVQRVTLDDAGQPRYKDVNASEVIDVNPATPEQIELLGSSDPLKLKKIWTTQDKVLAAAGLITALAIIALTVYAVKKSRKKEEKPGPVQGTYGKSRISNDVAAFEEALSRLGISRSGKQYNVAASALNQAVFSDVHFANADQFMAYYNQVTGAIQASQEANENKSADQVIRNVINSLVQQENMKRHAKITSSRPGVGGMVTKALSRNLPRSNQQQSQPRSFDPYMLHPVAQGGIGGAPTVDEENDEEEEIELVKGDTPNKT